MSRIWTMLALATLGGCGLTRALPSVVDYGPGSDEVVDRVWVATDGETEGAYRIFLSDGTMVTGSCDGPYRLAAWRAVEDGRLAWDAEDGAVRAEIAVVGPRQLGLIVDPDGAAVEETYRRAQSPESCG